MSFVRVNPGDLIQAHQLNQVLDALDGVSGAGQPIQLISLNDQNNYALSVENLDATNSRALNVAKSDGSLLIRADVTGVTLGTPLNLTAGSVAGTAIQDASITNAKLGPDVARANQLVNGGFEIWQRGNGPYTTAVAFADRWNINLSGGDTLSVSKDTTNVDSALGSTASAACTYTHSSGTTTGVFQRLTAGDGYQLGNRTVTFSIRVRTTTANAAQIVVLPDGATWQRGAFHTGDGTWQTLSMTVTLTAGQPWQFGVFFNASCTAYVDDAMLVLGSQAATYVPLPPADEWARCLRYYERFGPAGSNPLMRGYNVASAWIAQTLSFSQTKALTPSLTSGGTWSYINANSVIWDNPTLNGGRFGTTALATGDTLVQSANSGYLVAEANP